MSPHRPPASNPLGARTPAPRIEDFAALGAGRARRRRRPAKAPLTIERIVDVAFEVMARDGYEAISMRRLAQELGTGPASLYAHIDSKRELDALIVDKMAREIQVPEPDPAHWQDQVVQVCRDLRAAMLRHPGVARAVIGNVPTGTESMVTSERLLAILRAGGVVEQVAAWACDLLPLYVTAVAFEESVELQRARAAGGETGEQFAARLRMYFESLPADRFPHLVASAAALTTGNGEQRFDFGLRVLLSGLAVVSEGWPTGASTPSSQ